MSQTASDLTPGGAIQSTDLLVLYRPADLLSYSYYGSQLTQFITNPLTNLGDTFVGGIAGIPTALPGNLTATPQYLKSVGSGSSANAQSWAQIMLSDINGIGTAAGYNIGTTIGTIPLLTSTGLPVVSSGLTTVTDPTTSTIDSLNTALSNIYALAGAATDLEGGVLGSVPYQSAPNTTLFIAPNTTASLKVLSQTGTGSAGALPVWTSATSSATPSTIMTRSANNNTAANVITQNWATTVSSATPITLTVASAPYQVITGTTAQTIYTPLATGLLQYHTYIVENTSTQNVTLTANDTTTNIGTILAGSQAYVTVTNIGTSNGTWAVTASPLLISGLIPVPLLPVGTPSTLGALSYDGTIITGSTGAITVAKTSSTLFGVSKVDNVTITASGGVISAVNTGTVTAISIASANGFTGSSSGGATPALTVATSITGVLKGSGTALSAATSGTDYSLGTSALATGIVKSTTTTGALTIAIASDFPTLNQNTSGNAATATLATTATNIVGGAANSLPNQSGSGATQMLATSNSAILGTSSGGVLQWLTSIPAANLSTATPTQIGIANADGITLGEYVNNPTSIGATVATGTTPQGIVEFTISGTNYLTIANLGDSTISTYSWNGTAWVAFGSAVSTASSTGPTALTYYTISGTSYLSVTCSSANVVKTFTWSSGWGSITSVAAGSGGIGICSFVNSGTTYVVNAVNTDNTLQVFSSSGGTLTSVSTVSTGSGARFPVPYLINGIQYISIVNRVDSTFSTFTFSGGTLTSIGTAISLGAGTGRTLQITQINGFTYLTAINSSINELQIFYWNGVTYIPYGVVTNNMPSGPFGLLTFQIAGIQYLTVSGSSGNSLITYQWQNNTWTYIGTNSLSGGGSIYQVQYTISNVPYIACVINGTTTFATFSFAYNGALALTSNFATTSPFTNISAAKGWAYCKGFNSAGLSAGAIPLNGTNTFNNGLSINSTTGVNLTLSRQFRINVSLDVTVAIAGAATFTITGSGCTVVTQAITPAASVTEYINLTAIVTTTTGTPIITIVASSVSGVISIASDSTMDITEL